MELSRAELLAMFDEAVRPKVEEALKSVQGLAVYRNEELNQVKALALTSDPENEIDGAFLLVGTYTNPVGDLSRTQRALLWMDELNTTAYAAAKEFSLSPSAVYRAIDRRALNRCPCCGQTVKKH